ncbi:MAG: RICIN domain-containing protein [Spongiibacteraceae bacterium]|nr:RICIN domain-containing protein [Spongiibacteraceae bacterium]
MHGLIVLIKKLPKQFFNITAKTAFVTLLFLSISAKAQVPSNVWFVLESRHSGFVLDILNVSTDTGVELTQWYRTDTLNQQFRFLDSGDGYYRIQARHSSQVLDVYEWNAEDGATIAQWTDLNAINQQWLVKQNAEGYYSFTNRYSGKALDLWEWSTVAGSRLSQFTPSGEVNQQWKLLPVGTDYTVASNGTGTHTTMQSAINAASSGDSILVRAGTYSGHIEVPTSKTGITIVGETTNPADVVISDNRCASCANGSGGTWGTSGSATANLFGHDLTVMGVTIENAYNESVYGASQAVAVYARGDRQVYDNVRFLGNQDTLLTWTANTSIIARQYYRRVFVQGDVDFIFGRGTAVFDNSTIHALSRGSSSNNGYITAASTEITNPYGILFYQCTMTSNAPAGTFHLGRPWPAGGSTTARGQVLVRDSWLDAAIKSAPWTDMSGLAWEDARLSEYNNTGPGAGVNSNRPQMSASAAASYTPTTYLSGSDGWKPF